MPISFNIDIKSPDKLQKDILNEMANVMDKAISLATEPITEKIKNLVINDFKNNETCKSIINGDLQKIFLINHPESVINGIGDIIVNNIKIKRRKVRPINNISLTGGLDINLFSDDIYIQIINLPEASYVTHNNYFISWLEQVLDGGSGPMFTNAELVNTQNGIILTKKVGHNIAVPSQYAGQANDNFITKFLLSLENDVNDIVFKEVDKRIY